MQYVAEGYPSDEVLEIFVEFNSPQDPIYLTSQLETNGIGISQSGVLVKTGTEVEKVEVILREVKISDYLVLVQQYIAEGWTLLSESIIDNKDKNNGFHKIVVVGEPSLDSDFEVPLSSDYDCMIAATFVDKKLEANKIIFIYYPYNLQPL
jgi:hypothetical protein